MEPTTCVLCAYLKDDVNTLIKNKTLMIKEICRWLLLSFCKPTESPSGLFNHSGRQFFNINVFFSSKESLHRPVFRKKHAMRQMGGKSQFICYHSVQVILSQKRRTDRDIGPICCRTLARCDPCCIELR